MVNQRGFYDLWVLIVCEEEKHIRNRGFNKI